MLLDDGGRELVLVASAGRPPTGPARPSHAVRRQRRRSCPRHRASRSSSVRSTRKRSSTSSRSSARSRPASWFPSGCRAERSASSTSRSPRPEPVHRRRPAPRADVRRPGGRPLIHRTKLHEQAEHRSSDLWRSIESSKGLLGTLDIETLTEPSRRSHAARGSKQGFVCLFDAETGALTRGVFRGLDKARSGSHRAARDRSAVEDRPCDLIDVGEDSRAFVAIGLRTPAGDQGSHRGLGVRGSGSRSAATSQGVRATVLHRASAPQSSTRSSRPRNRSSLDHPGRSQPDRPVDAAARSLRSTRRPSSCSVLTAMFAAGTPVRGTLGTTSSSDSDSARATSRTKSKLGPTTRTYKVHAHRRARPRCPDGPACSSWTT